MATHHIIDYVADDESGTVTIYASHGGNCSGFGGQSNQGNISIGGMPYVGGYPPLIATPCLPNTQTLDITNSSFANIACAGGHKASEDATEYIDGEIVTNCVGCGERMIIPRVPGAIPVLKLKAFIGAIMGLDFSNEDDADFNLSDILGLFAEIKHAIGIEDDALSRAHSLLDIAEKLIQQKLVERAL